MDIAFLHPLRPTSDGTGAVHSATRIVDLLIDSGHKVVVYCAFDEPVSDSKYDCKNIPTDGFPYHSKTKLNAELRDRAPEFSKYDVFHSYLPSSIPGVNEIEKRTGTPSVVSLNAYGGICPKNDLRYLGETNCSRRGPLRCARCIASTRDLSSGYQSGYETISLLGNLRLIQQVAPFDVEISRFHALSDHIKNTYAEFGYPKDRISVIPNILDESFLVEHKSQFTEPYQLLHVGQLKKHKGVDMLPEILSQLQNQTDYEFELTIVGDGPLLAALEMKAERLGVTDLIDFRGYISNKNLPSVYAEHDLFVYPGRWHEPFGRIFLESLAAGTPVIGSDVGAVKEILRDAGVTTDPSVDAFVSTIVEIIRDGRLPTFAKNAKSRAKRYTEAEVGSSFDDLYTEIRKPSVSSR